MKARVFQCPSGEVIILRFKEQHRLPGETDDELCARLGPIELEKAKSVTPELCSPSLVWDDIDLTDIPPKDANRFRWRVRQRGEKKVVEVDLTVPDRGGPL